uniref:Uncharacterized protein n=1 Tax=Zea mays TaxID=4577 RepID=B6UAE2_MAIZE|nr:hypothetical protein [Zea mays]
MKGGKKEVAGAVVAILLVLQLMAAPPTAMAARSPHGAVPDGSLATTPKVTMLSATLCYTGETCKYTPCFTPACSCSFSDRLCYVIFTPVA